MRKNKKPTVKQVRRRYNKKGLKMAHSNRKVRRVRAKVEPEDTFLDENSKVNLEDAVVMNPTVDDVREVINDLDGFRDWERESRGNNLTYGDY